MNILPRFSSRSYKTEEEFNNDLIRYEAKIGSDLFGAIPKGHSRQFFCLDDHTWIWHEEWKDEQGKRRSSVTKYMVRPSGIIKSQNGSAYSGLSDRELTNLVTAIRMYISRVKNEYLKALNPTV
jgi:hypothetical protein